MKKFWSFLMKLIGKLILIGFIGFVATFALAKVTTHIVEILFKQFARILINGIKRAVKIDGDILFHCCDVC